MTQKKMHKSNFLRKKRNILHTRYVKPHFELPYRSNMAFVENIAYLANMAYSAYSANMAHLAFLWLVWQIWLIQLIQ